MHFPPEDCDKQAYLCTNREVAYHQRLGDMSTGTSTAAHSSELHTRAAYQTIWAEAVLIKQQRHATTQLCKPHLTMMQEPLSKIQLASGTLPLLALSVLSGPAGAGEACAAAVTLGTPCESCSVATTMPMPLVRPSLNTKRVPAVMYSGRCRNLQAATGTAKG